MFAELFATYLRLQKWKANPHAMKRQIGIMSSWMTADPANDQPISPYEIDRMKDFLHTHAPTINRSLIKTSRELDSKSGYERPTNERR